METLEHAHEIIHEEVTAGTGINRRIKLGIKAGWCAVIKAIWFDVMGTSMLQGVCVDPTKIGTIGDSEVNKGRDILIYLSQVALCPWMLPEPGFVVVRDLLYMVDITFTGALDYGVHVLYVKKKIDAGMEAGLLLQRR